MRSWNGRGNQYIQLIRVLYSKLLTNSKQLPAFPLEAMPGTEPPQQAIGYQKEIKKTLGKTSETDAYLKFEMTSYVKCQTDL